MSATDADVFVHASYGANDILHVEQRFTHTHEDDVRTPLAVRVLELQHLRNDFRRREIPLKSLQSRGAKRTLLRAPNLARDARRQSLPIPPANTAKIPDPVPIFPSVKARRVWYPNRLNHLPLAHRQQQLSRPIRGEDGIHARKPSRVHPSLHQPRSQTRWNVMKRINVSTPSHAVQAIGDLFRPVLGRPEFSDESFELWFRHADQRRHHRASSRGRGHRRRCPHRRHRVSLALKKCTHFFQLCDCASRRRGRRVRFRD